MLADLPDALLFTAAGCVHCAAVKRGLEDLKQQGLVGGLMVVDVATHPEQAAQWGVRSVPWLRLGAFTLTGAQSPAELRRFAAWARDESGAAHYVEHLLKQGGYGEAAAFIAEDVRRLQPLLAIVANPAANLEVRLGVSALLESYANTPELQQLLSSLADISRHADHRVRADACYLLGCTGSSAARDHLAARLNDESAEVREIAAEALAELKSAK